jgi:glycosyltransferase involved in cell wall biosynthesis
MRIGAVVITPPRFKASGGVAAGLQLTQEIAKLVDAELFLMAETDGYSVDLELPVTRQRPQNLLLPFQKVLPRAAVSLAWRPKLKNWLRKGRFDIVHFHNPHPPGALSDAARDCMAGGVPYVMSTHGFVEFNSFSRGFGAPAWQKPLLEVLVRRPVIRVAKGAERILMTSPLEVPIMLSMGLDRSKLSIVTNGVDPYYAEIVPEDVRKRLTARFNLPTDRPLMLFVGNHTANKGLDVLLKSLSLMQQNACAIVAGEIRSSHEHAKLLSEAGVSRSAERLIFTDFMTNEELRALYQTADLFVFPTRADTLPLVVLEAMASSLAVVSTRVGGIPFEVTPETGILVDPGDAIVLAEALDRLCARPEVRRSMGAAGRLRVLDNFDWSNSAKLAIEIYQGVLSEQQRKKAGL